MSVITQTIDDLLLAESDGRHEIRAGELVEKPPMSFGHNWSARRLAYQLMMQLSPDEYEVLQNGGQLRGPDGESCIPDVAVVPVSITADLAANPRRFESYHDSVPFVAEVWSPKTGTFDVETKFPIYRLRGDAEIWRLHPFEKSLTTWRRQANGIHVPEMWYGGTIALHALPFVVIDLDKLFTSATAP